MNSDNRPIMLDFATSLFIRTLVNARATVTVPAYESEQPLPYFRYVEAMFPDNQPLEGIRVQMIDIARQSAIKWLSEKYPEAEIMAAMDDAIITVEFSQLVPIE